jgi:DNA-binding winged helix-turn-helix (wHTH) protein
MDTPVPADVFLFEAFWFDRRAGALFRREEGGALVPVAIGSRALAVLDTLVARQGDLVSKEEIMHAVWPETVVEDNNLTVQISALRRVLDQARAGGSCIQTIAGRGYRFLGRLARDGGDSRPRLSIVVLPFANLSNDPEQQYFADGITEDVTTDLSRISGMFVISRNTAFTYRNSCRTLISSAGANVRKSRVEPLAGVERRRWFDESNGCTGGLPTFDNPRGERQGCAHSRPSALTPERGGSRYCGTR